MHHELCGDVTPGGRDLASEGRAETHKTHGFNHERVRSEPEMKIPPWRGGLLALSLPKGPRPPNITFSREAG